MKIMSEQKGILAITELNKCFPIKAIEKKWNIGKLRIRYSFRSKDNLWGRFGGGWNWKIGIQAGGKTVIVSLFICEVIICIESAKSEGGRK